MRYSRFCTVFGLLAVLSFAVFGVAPALAQSGLSPDPTPDSRVEWQCTFDFTASDHGLEVISVYRPAWGTQYLGTYIGGTGWQTEEAPFDWMYGGYRNVVNVSKTIENTNITYLSYEIDVSGSDFDSASMVGGASLSTGNNIIVYNGETTYGWLGGSTVASSIGAYIELYANLAQPTATATLKTQYMEGFGPNPCAGDTPDAIPITRPLKLADMLNSFSLSSLPDRATPELTSTSFIYYFTSKTSDDLVHAVVTGEVTSVEQYSCDTNICYGLLPAPDDQMVMFNNLESIYHVVITAGGVDYHYLLSRPVVEVGDSVDVGCPIGYVMRMDSLPVQYISSALTVAPAVYSYNYTPGFVDNPVDGSGAVILWAKTDGYVYNEEQQAFIDDGTNADLIGDTPLLADDEPDDSACQLAAVCLVDNGSLQNNGQGWIISPPSAATGNGVVLSHVNYAGRDVVGAMWQDITTVANHKYEIHIRARREAVSLVNLPITLQLSDNAGAIGTITIDGAIGTGEDDSSITPDTTPVVKDYYLAWRPTADNQRFTITNTTAYSVLSSNAARILSVCITDPTSSQNASPFQAICLDVEPVATLSTSIFGITIDIPNPLDFVRWLGDWLNNFWNCNVLGALDQLWKLITGIWDTIKHLTTGGGLSEFLTQLSKTLKLDTVIGIAKSIMDALTTLYYYALKLFTEILRAFVRLRDLVTLIVNALTNAPPPDNSFLPNCVANPRTHGMCIVVWVAENTVMDPARQGTLIMTLLIGMGSLKLIAWVMSEYQKAVINLTKNASAA